MDEVIISMASCTCLSWTPLKVVLKERRLSGVVADLGSLEAPKHAPLTDVELYSLLTWVLTRKGKFIFKIVL